MDMSTSSLGAISAQAAQQQSELKGSKPIAQAPRVAPPSDLVQIDGVEGITNVNEDRGPRGDQQGSTLGDEAGHDEGVSATSVTKDAVDDGRLDLLG